MGKGFPAGGVSGSLAVHVGGMVIILLFGAPGSGKGTQSRFISECRKIPAISTGEMLRAECQVETVLGVALRSIIAAGSLVDDELVNDLVVHRVTKPDCSGGFILDGYPRTAAQADFLARFVKDSKLPEPTVIHLDVPTPVLVARLSSRQSCPACGRSYNLQKLPTRTGRCDADGQTLIARADDAAEVVSQRLEAYHKLSEPLIEYYQGANYHRIDGQCAPERISDEIRGIIAGHAGNRANGAGRSSHIV